MWVTKCLCGVDMYDASVARRLTGKHVHLATSCRLWRQFFSTGQCARFSVFGSCVMCWVDFSLKSREHEVVYRGNIVLCNTTIMWTLCNTVQSFQFMPVESKQNKCAWRNVFNNLSTHHIEFEQVQLLALELPDLLAEEVHPPQDAFRGGVQHAHHAVLGATDCNN